MIDINEARVDTKKWLNANGWLQDADGVTWRKKGQTYRVQLYEAQFRARGPFQHLPALLAPGFTAERVQEAVREVLNTRSFAGLLTTTQQESRVSDIVTALTEDILSSLAHSNGDPHA